MLYFKCSVVDLLMLPNCIWSAFGTWGSSVVSSYVHTHIHTYFPYNTYWTVCSVFFFCREVFIRVLAPYFSLCFIFPRLLRAVLDFFLLFVSSYGMSCVPFLFFFLLFFRASSHLCFPCPVKFLAPVITRLSASVLHLCVIVSHCLL